MCGNSNKNMLLNVQSENGKKKACKSLEMQALKVVPGAGIEPATNGLGNYFLSTK